MDMNKEEWQKINSIIDRALRIEAADKREAYIRETCDNERLCQLATRFLDAIEKAEEEGFMEWRE